MELTFQTSPLHFLRCTVQEVHFQEETMDTIVPDSYPDIAFILDCYADSIVRGKECRDRNVVISGGLKGGILYQPENESTPRCLELYMPFSVKFDNPELTEHSQVIVSVRVRSVDARMINSRKAMLRVGLGCEITAYQEDKEEVYELKSTDPRIQVKTEQYFVELPLEASEKSFVLNDTIDLSGHPDIQQIYKTVLSLYPSDQKVVANKAIFKGNLSCKILYMTADNSMHCLHHQFPYSQYCELTTDYDEETVTVYPAITGYDVQSDPSDRSSALQINVNILMQCLVNGRKELNLVTDAYSISGSMDPVWKTYSFNTCLDNLTVQKNVRKTLSGNIRSVLDLDLYWDYPALRQNENGKSIILPVTIHALGKDEDGLWVQKSERTEICEDIQMDGTCMCKATMIPISDAYAVLTAGGAEINAVVQLRSLCCAGNTLKTLSGAEIKESEETNDKVPSLIVKSAEKNTPIWDLAKYYRTTEHLIKTANGFSTDHIPEDMLVLLPIT